MYGENGSRYLRLVGVKQENTVLEWMFSSSSAPTGGYYYVYVVQRKGQRIEVFAVTNTQRTINSTQNFLLKTPNAYS